MSFDLMVDADRWRAHLSDLAERVPGLTPVIKGNGYGLGRDLLAAEATRLDVPLIAVGTYHEVPAALAEFSGDVLVLTPWRPYFAGAGLDVAIANPRIIHTLSRLEDITELATIRPGARVVIEGETSMARHGFDRHELAAVAAASSRLDVEGFGIHLPLMPDNLREADHWAGRLLASQLDTTTFYVSHLNPTELDSLRERRPDLDVRPRIGTNLWLGDLEAFSVQSIVLDVHQVTRGERTGYRQRPAPRDGHLLVLAGGTSHGLGLEAPRAVGSPADRAKRVARGGLEAAGYSLSPFIVSGKQRWFAEPPHMQVSLVFVPASVEPPAAGDTVTAAVRYTTTTFDTVTLA